MSNKVTLSDFCFSPYGKKFRAFVVMVRNFELNLFKELCIEVYIRAPDLGCRSIIVFLAMPLFFVFFFFAGTGTAHIGRTVVQKPRAMNQCATCVTSRIGCSQRKLNIIF